MALPGTDFDEGGGGTKVTTGPGQIHMFGYAHRGCLLCRKENALTLDHQTFSRLSAPRFETTFI